MKHTEQSKLKMRLAKLGKKMKPEVRARMIGRKLSKEHKQHIKDSHPKYWLGKKRSKEDIEKFRVAHLGQSAWNKGLKLPQFGEDKASAWKGGKVGYGALHEWVYKNKGRPDICEFCGETFKNPYQIHWANKSGKYKRNLNDWLRLCVRCHHLFDRKRHKK